MLRSLKKQINTTQQSNLQLRYRVQTRFSIWGHTSNQRRHSNTSFFTSCHPPGVKKGFAKGEALRLLRTNSSMKTFEENITMERGYPQNFTNNALSEEVWTKDTSPPPMKWNKKTNLALHNTIPPGSSKSQRNLNEEVVPNTATTIAKSNFQGAAHNIIQKRTLP